MELVDLLSSFGIDFGEISKEENDELRKMTEKDADILFGVLDGRIGFEQVNRLWNQSSEYAINSGNKIYDGDNFIRLLNEVKDSTFFENVRNQAPKESEEVSGMISQESANRIKVAVDVLLNPKYREKKEMNIP